MRLPSQFSKSYGPGRRSHGPDVAEDPDFQRKEWIFERCGWAARADLVVAAATGVFGGGALAIVTIRAPDDSFSVDYSQFARVQSPATVTITSMSGATVDEPIRVFLSEDYLRELTISAIVPPPEPVEPGRASGTIGRR